MPEFDSFDWTDERWQKYYNSLYPQPSLQQTLKFKRKWYKKEIDPSFDADATDDTGAAKTSTSATTTAPPPAASRPPMSPMLLTARFVTLGSFVIGILLSLISLLVRGKLRGWGCLGLAVGFVMSLVLKLGLPKFKAAYWQAAFNAEALHALMMLMAGIPVLSSPLALASPVIAAVLEAGVICESLSLMPQVSKMIAMNRYQLSRWRARMEVVQGVMLVLSVIRGQARFIQPFVYWHTLRLKTPGDPFLGEVFRSVHGVISRALSHAAVPAAVSNVYAKIYAYLSRA